MYKPICKPKQVLCGNGQDAIVTGWTSTKVISKYFKSEDYKYGVIGQLYCPKRGIDYLIRNLLANPQITRVFLLAFSKEDHNVKSCYCLKDFFEHGVFFNEEVDKWQINSEIEGYIDSDIPLNVLNELRENIESYFYTDKQYFLQSLLTSNRFKELLPVTRKYYKYIKVESETKTTVGDLYHHTVTANNINEAWLKLMYLIRTRGKIRPTGYDGQWQELIGLKVIVTDEPDEYYFPDYLPSKEALENYIPYMVNDLEYSPNTKYTYGNRLRSWFGKDQVEQVIHKLANEKDCASAVMSLWDSGSGNHKSEAIARHNRGLGDSDHNHSGSPCLNHIWVRIVDNELILSALFRSNDMFSAWVTNTHGIRALQKHIWTELNAMTDYNLTLGNLITISQSAHIYDDCWESANEILEKHYKPKTIKHDDKVGNFIIEYQDKIIVQQYALNGDLVKEYSGKNPLKILKEIAHYNPDIQPFHIGYIGLELQKAITLTDTYFQDN